METKEGRQVRVLEGNLAAAYGVLLSKPDVISCFPITPQSSLGEALSRFVADGLLDAEMVEPEGENSALSILIGASVAGGRTSHQPLLKGSPLCMTPICLRQETGFPS